MGVWGVITLGGKNSSGIKDGFVLTGPYRFTRNPQYVGNIMFFVGTSIVANSLLLWITHALLSLVFVLYPITEERWLEDHYGQAERCSCSPPAPDPPSLVRLPRGAQTLTITSSSASLRSVIETTTFDHSRTCPSAHTGIRRRTSMNAARIAHRTGAAVPLQ